MLKNNGSGLRSNIHVLNLHVYTNECSTEKMQSCDHINLYCKYKKSRKSGLKNLTTTMKESENLSFNDYKGNAIL